MSQARELSLFPLNVVLFPGMSLPLHIFEERYKLMIRQCLEEDRTFGVVFIKSGKEVGEPATPFSVGTIARIDRVEPLSNGRMNLTATGQQRFRIRELLQEHPYLKGMVEPLPEEDPEKTVEPELLKRIQEQAAAYVQMIIGLRGGWIREVPTPQEPQSLSYFVAATLQIDPSVRQQLLETPFTPQRLQQELKLLQEEMARLQGELQEKHKHLGPRRN